MRSRFFLLAATSFAALTLAGCQTRWPLPSPRPHGPHPVAQPTTPVAPPAQVATAGPLTPSGVGRYMDALERDLRARLRGRGVVVARRGDDMLVSVPDAKLFANERLSGAGLGLLGSVAMALRIHDRTRVLVSGYTDTSGSVAQNLEVSRRRAAVVGAALAQAGVAAERIETHGLGESNLKIATGDQVSEPRNRRIELRIVAKPG
ncbi:MAG: OmpA family protein [Alphaproteobacteria bacterium]|nr:OmpA family protein [Alphaproteobacteria bacterium]MDE2631296.1 OmpA family protein [Alphaproteobacteria bacterium]